MQENRPKGKLNPPVFYSATALIAALLLFTALFP